MDKEETTSNDYHKDIDDVDFEKITEGVTLSFLGSRDLTSLLSSTVVPESDPSASIERELNKDPTEMLSIITIPDDPDTTIMETLDKENSGLESIAVDESIKAALATDSTVLRNIMDSEDTSAFDKGDLSIYTIHSNTFKCDQCDETFLSKTVFDHHIITFHVEETVFTCEKCDENFHSKTTLDHHMITFHGTIPSILKDQNQSSLNNERDVEIEIEFLKSKLKAMNDENKTVYTKVLIEEI